MIQHKYFLTNRKIRNILKSNQTFPLMTTKQFFFGMNIINNQLSNYLQTQLK